MALVKVVSIHCLDQLPLATTTYSSLQSQGVTTGSLFSVLKITVCSTPQYQLVSSSLMHSRCLPGFRSENSELAGQEWLARRAEIGRASCRGGAWVSLVP